MDKILITRKIMSIYDIFLVDLLALLLFL